MDQATVATTSSDRNADTPSIISTASPSIFNSPSAALALPPLDSPHAATALSDDAPAASPQAGPSNRRSKRQTATAGSSNPAVLAHKAPKRSGKAKGTQYIPVDDSKLCLHMPEADQHALDSFIRLENCTYQNRNIGLARTQEDNFACECKFHPEALLSAPEHYACGEESGCINRLTQVECDPSECRSKHHCQNQRIQRGEIAPIKIIKTEKKGCGVMANADLPAHLFITEYIGEVIGHSNFVRRIRDYGDEGIEHFYFMALQRDEYIDATKKGGLGRFLNHSCEPNCYVAKWVVGKRLRMAIFTKRPIRYGEELTFNYNVDRYGHDAQECFCGESTCVGFIGGKTQTDIGIMDDLFLDALGIAEEVEQLQLKGNKRKKGLKLDEDYIPTMRAMEVEEVPRVTSAIRQALNNKRILTKLLQRVVLTEDNKVHGQIMRLRGFSLMTMVLDEHGDDYEAIVIPVLQIFLKWPLIAKNKVANTNAEELVNKVVSEAQEQQAIDLANKCLAVWNELELSYRIPVNKATDISEAEKRKREELQATFHSFKRQRVEEPAVETSNTPKPAPPSFTTAPPTKVVFTAQLPKGWLAATDSSNNKTYYYHEASRTTRWSIPSAAEAGSVEDQWRREKDKREAQRRPKTLEEIMSSIAASEMERKKKQEEESTTVQAATDAMKTKADGPVAKPLSLHKASKKSKHSRHKQASKSSNKSREHEALKLFTPVVIGVLSKYARKHLDRDQFKKRAKELSHLLVDKEKKSSRWETEDYSKMTPEKEKKMRSFCKDWVAKLVVRCKASKSSKSASSPSKSTTSTPAPTTESSHEDRDDSSIDKEMADLMAEVNGEQQEEDMENDDDDGDEGASPQPSASDSTPAFDTQQFHEQSQSGSRSPSTAPPPPPPVSAVQVVGESTLGDANAEATMTLEEADLAVEATNHNDTSLLVVEEQNGHGINGQSHIIPAVPAPPPPPDI